MSKLLDVALVMKCTEWKNASRKTHIYTCENLFLGNEN